MVFRVTVAAAEESNMLAINSSYAQDARVITQESQAALGKSRRAAESNDAWMAAHMEAIDANGQGPWFAKAEAQSASVPATTGSTKMVPPENPE